MSRPVVVFAYQARWADDFARLAKHIRSVVGPAAIRVDHIGSTAVPGLGAKDVIDVQITVSDLDAVDRLTIPLGAAGFRGGTAFEYDVFHGKPAADPELRKRFMREPEGERRAHVHIRERGRFNQRYALLFRDYLRASEEVRAAYEVLKRRAAQLFPDDVDGYLFLKDPVLHIIYAAASLWAEKVGWTPDEDYVAGFAERLGDAFPGCPESERRAIADHACRKYSGRIGRSAASARFDPVALNLAVKAHIRHRHTAYDKFLARGIERGDARAAVREAVEEVVERWKAAPA